MKNVKKSLLLLPILLLFFAFFGITVSAEGTGTDEVDEIIDSYGNILPENTKAPSGTEDVVGAIGFEAILGEIAAALENRRGEIASFFFLLLGTSVLMALSGLIADNFGGAVRCCAASVTSLIVFQRIMPLINEISSSLGSISNFFSALVPIYCSCMALGGGGYTASGAGVGMSITLEVCSQFTEKFLLLLVFAMFFSSVAGSFGGGVSAVSRAVKTLFTRGLALLSTVFIGMLTLQTVISASADNMALRTARYAATSIIPIVGGTVSGALSTLVGGAAYAKGIIGGGAVGVILSFAIAPLVTLLLYKLCFFVAIGFLEFCTAEEGVKCLTGIRDALDALISVYTLTVVLYILEITVILIVGVNY